MVREHKRSKGSHNPLNLLGLGKEVWRDKETRELIDAQEYVNGERDCWDGYATSSPRASFSALSPKWVLYRA